MAAVNLPDNPANGTTSTVNGITYTYNSSKGYWTAAASSGGGGGGGASVSTSDAAPGSPSDGDLWYDTDDGGMFVYYQDSDSSQWVEVIGSQGAPGPAGAAGASTAGVASVYATVNALPTTGNTQGDMAHVTANNTLYFWNGSGWYKIALINTNPSISGVASTYSLALDGTATTVTMTATDPEGLPITYSIASDTSGNVATVSQGTGASTNVFTITPSTNTAYAGSFTLTFRASDGVNIATAPATFTLQFSVQNSKYTSSLITSVGANNAVNNSFDDKSTSDHTITANGDATQTTFSPYRHGGYSTYFDGTGDYITAPNHTSFDFGTGDFTIETWINIPDVTSTWLAFISRGYAQEGGWRLYKNTGNSNLRFYWSTGGTTYHIEATSTGLTNNTWHHIAIVRNSSTTTIYVDGVSKGSGTISTSLNPGTYAVEIGSGVVQSSYPITGYMTDVRIVKGTAVYTSAFSAPTERLTAVTNTSLLTCHLPYFADGSTNGHTITPNGNASTRPLAPYDGQEYSAASHLGSASLDGTGDFLSVGDHADFEFGSGDFTMEAWIYLTGYSNSYGGYYAGGIMGKDSASNRSFTFSVVATSNSYTGLQLYLFNGGTSTSTIGTASMGLNQWYHVAATRASGTVKLFLNGTQIQSGTNSTNIDNTTSPFVVGASSSYSNYEYRLNGNISDARVVKGTAVYTSNFTPPTSPLTAVTNTKLLVQSTDAGIIDKAQRARDLRLFGNTKSSTTQNKFLTSSMYFDGSGDYLKWTNTEAVDFGIGGEAFTLEWWQWWPSIVDSRSVGPQTGGTTAGWNGTSGHQWTMFTYSSSASLFMQWWNGSSRTDYELNHGGALTASTWQHFAVVYDGTNLSNYIDGTRIGHRTSGNTFGTVTNRFAVLGGNTAGTGQSEIYYSDVRITKGLARYSGTSLTVPTAALQG